MVGHLAGTDAYFRRNSVDSHFGVGNPTDGANDGVVYQWVDTSRIAYANLEGNRDVISIETADGGNPNNPWSPKAIDALVKLGIWVCKTHNIPPELIKGNLPGTRGLAYHRQGCVHSSSYRPRGWPYDQWRVPGGVKWSNAVGKVCPGDVRIKQLVDIVIPRIAAGVNGEEDELSGKADEILQLAKYNHERLIRIEDRVENIEKGGNAIPDSEGIFHQVTGARYALQTPDAEGNTQYKTEKLGKVAGYNRTDIKELRAQLDRIEANLGSPKA